MYGVFLSSLDRFDGDIFVDDISVLLWSDRGESVFIISMCQVGNHHVSGV